MAAVYVGIPVVLWWYPGRRHLMIAIWAASATCLAYLLRDRSFDRCRLHTCSYRHWTPLLIRIAVIIGLLTLYTALFERQHLVRLPREEPALWAHIVLLYPFLSALPQELVYRTFFFHRYRALFVNERMMILANAALFAFGHVPFRNWIAITVSFAAGLLWAGTYLRSRSLPVVAIEHSLYGNLAFTIGVGDYFLLLVL